MTDIQTIYFDVDGVLADLDGRVEELYGVTISEIAASMPDNWWNEEFLTTQLDQGVFETLNPLPDFWSIVALMHELVDMDYKVELLSSCTTDHYDQIRKQKRVWLREYELDCFRWNFVKESSDKDRYANPTSLLIDDYKVPVDAFKEAGGVTIKYESYDSMMEQLKELGVI